MFHFTIFPQSHQSQTPRSAVNRRPNSHGIRVLCWRSEAPKSSGPVNPKKVAGIYKIHHSKATQSHKICSGLRVFAYNIHQICSWFVLELPEGPFSTEAHNMGVSINGGTSKSSILVDFFPLSQAFWDTPIYGNHRISWIWDFPSSNDPRFIHLKSLEGGTLALTHNTFDGAPSRAIAFSCRTKVLEFHGLW